MSQKVLPTTLIFIGAFFILTNSVSAAPADHLVISQVQITGGAGKTTNDFVEIYNSTSSDIDLQGMRLVKRTKTGTTDTLLKSFTDSVTIKAKGYYLWANSSFADIAVTPDVTTTGSLADDNGVAIRNGPNDTGAIIDTVAWGEATNAFVEGTVFATNPAANQSLERKPGSGAGNGEDSNNNAEDFFLQASAHPRNSASPTEPSSSSSPPPSPPPPAPAPAGGGFFELEISEIFPNPKGKDAGSEWVELYNAGAVEINISGWYVDDDGAEDLPSTNAVVIPETTKIAGQNYLLIQIPKGKFALNNSGFDAVRIFDNSKILKLRQGYLGPVKEGYSYAKDNSGQWVWTESPSPAAANSFVTPTIYLATLRISEILPNPEGDDAEGEYIEFFNFGTDSLDLADWVVADERKRYKVSEEDFADTEIPAGGYFVIYREVSGISLNNSGDEILKLVNPIGELVDTIGFDASDREAEAYAWEVGTIYRWTAFPTPGDKNQFVVAAAQPGKEQVKPQDRKPDEKIKEAALREIRELPIGTRIKTSGVIIVEPGILGERVSYLQGSGLRIFLPQETGLDLTYGMLIGVTGELSLFHNELQLKVEGQDAVQILKSGEEVEIHEARTGDIGESWEGFLVKISGEVTESSGDTFYLDDGSGQARIYIRESTGIEKPRLKQGMQTQVIGVVSQYDDIYRIMPRYQSDLVVGNLAGVQTETTLPRTGIDFWPIIAFFLAFCYIIIILKNLSLKKERIARWTKSI